MRTVRRTSEMRFFYDQKKIENKLFDFVCIFKKVLYLFQLTIKTN